MIRSRLRLVPILLTGLLCVGCSGVEVLRSEGKTSWLGCGLTFALPPGQWSADILEADRYVELRNEADGVSLFVVRMDASEELPPVVAIRRLFAAFDDKTLVAESPFELPDGTKGIRALYNVKVEETTRRVMAVAFRKGSWMYDLAAWGMSREDFDAVVSSLSTRE